ncbi:MAG: hypothetical protein IKA79_08210, partial [Lentisphaeria bacterium]|nr:hypothetical protein [Lentisphaeria bacterium]
AGWIKELAKTADGLLAIVKYWTKEAESLILNGQYRYFSPTLCFSPDGSKVIALHSVALTNHPALHGIAPLAANDLAVKNESAGVSQQTASLPECISLAENVALLADLQKKETQWSALLKKFSCSSLADAEKKLTLAQENFYAEKIRMAFRMGKLTENMRQWADLSLRKDPELFELYLQCAPVLVPDNAFTDQAAVNGHGVYADPTEEEIFSMLGLTEKNIFTGKSL